jgi:hypothetical protein
MYWVLDLVQEMHTWLTISFKRKSPTCGKKSLTSGEIRFPGIPFEEGCRDPDHPYIVASRNSDKHDGRVRA